MEKLYLATTPLLEDEVQKKGINEKVQKEYDANYLKEIKRNLIDEITPFDKDEFYLHKDENIFINVVLLRKAIL